MVACPHNEHPAGQHIQEDRSRPLLPRTGTGSFIGPTAQELPPGLGSLSGGSISGGDGLLLKTRSIAFDLPLHRKHELLPTQSLKLATLFISANG